MIFNQNAYNKKVEPCVIILFGATGDLAHRKLLPALYKLENENALHRDSLIVGFARKEKTSGEFAKEVKESIGKHSKSKINPKTWKSFEKKILYHTSTFDDLHGYKRLYERIRELCARNPNRCNRISYLAAPPAFFETIIRNLKKSKLTQSAQEAWSRVAFEKPFGHDLKSAKGLNDAIKKAFREEQIYRIDHYLGKELVQNLLVLRFANNIFDSMWNKEFIDHVQITVAEDLGVEGRSSYYDKSGALRDIIQNHMMQLLSLTAMEPPKSLQPDDIRKEKIKVLENIHRFSQNKVKDVAVRGQYEGGNISGRRVPSYTEEENVARNSSTETFAALKLFISNNRWRNVPFYVRTGKRLSERVAEIYLVFKKTACHLFREYSKGLGPNLLIIRIQPEEGISVQFSAKVPGPKMVVDNVRMDFCHECRFGPNTPEAYERLLYNIMIGDQTLFTRWEEVENSWKIVDRIAARWKKDKNLPRYKAGSWGPKEADRLIERDGRKWIKPQKPTYSALLGGSL